MFNTYVGLKKYIKRQIIVTLYVETYLLKPIIKNLVA